MQQVAPYVPAAGSGYEFSSEENGIIDETAGRTRVWGIIAIVIGCVQIVLGVLGAVGGKPAQLVTAVNGGVSVLVGIYFVAGARALRAVVRTQGNDVQHLMQALGKLGTSFFIQSAATLIAFVLGFVVAFAFAAPL